MKKPTVEQTEEVFTHHRESNRMKKLDSVALTMNRTV
jgi:hypothetical protein